MNSFSINRGRKNCCSLPGEKGEAIEGLRLEQLALSQTCFFLFRYLASQLIPRFRARRFFVQAGGLCATSSGGAGLGLALCWLALGCVNPYQVLWRRIPHSWKDQRLDLSPASVVPATSKTPPVAAQFPTCFVSTSARVCKGTFTVVEAYLSTGI